MLWQACFGLVALPTDPAASSSVAVARRETLAYRDEPVMSRSMGPLALAQKGMVHRQGLLLVTLLLSTTWERVVGDAPPRRDGQTSAVGKLQRRWVRVRRDVNILTSEFAKKSIILIIESIQHRSR